MPNPATAGPRVTGCRESTPNAPVQLGGGGRFWIGLTLMLGSTACESPPPPVQQQRSARALQPVDTAKKRTELIESRRIYDRQANLLPSDEIVAGIRLPRGMTAKLHVENRYYFHTETPILQVLRYFAPRLLTAEILPAGTQGHEYLRATTRDGDKPHIVTVRIGPSSEHVATVEVKIIDHSMETIRTVQPFARSQAQLKALREHAE